MNSLSEEHLDDSDKSPIQMTASSLAFTLKSLNMTRFIKRVTRYNTMLFLIGILKFQSLRTVTKQSIVSNDDDLLPGVRALLHR